MAEVAIEAGISRTTVFKPIDEMSRCSSVPESTLIQRAVRARTRETSTAEVDAGRAHDTYRRKRGETKWNAQVTISSTRSSCTLRTSGERHLTASDWTSELWSLMSLSRHLHIFRSPSESGLKASLESSAESTGGPPAPRSSRMAVLL